MLDQNALQAATAETVQNLVRLIRIDTSNPPGSEAPAILAIKDMLEAAGFDPGAITIVEAAPNRTNLVARLRGDGSQRPLLLSGHVDVVPVERTHWSRDPFAGDVADGCVWGRGTLDMKGFLAMYLQVFLEAFRHKLPLKRDLILAAVADEEVGSVHGARFLAEKHPALIDAEYGFTEGGAFPLDLGQVRLCPIQVAEKGVCPLRVTATGQPGHGSMPRDDNAVLQLAHALDRLRRARHLPVHITPTMRSMLAAVAAQAGFPANVLAQMLRSPGLASLLLRAVPAASRPLLTALLSNTVSPTLLQGGVKINVIPSQVTATLDCRILPGQTPADAVREVQAIMGRDVKVEAVDWPEEGTEFPTHTPLYQLLERITRQRNPGALVMPYTMAGATDARCYKHAGITMYGYTPGAVPKGFPLLQMAHGHDERLPISFIEAGLPALWQVINEFCV
jgi:acetylornithine deacetylase/succinyl-diaminopimelate desuccinylase-like protein